MKDREGKVIYIGKAGNLRSRIKTYFSGGDGRSQIEFLVQRLTDIETIVTQDESQALVLERDLIKKYRPRYNIRLKDDKAFLSVRIDESREWPRIELVRRIEEDGADYFGPFASGGEVKQLVELINKVVPLRTCSDTVLKNRQRPCLEYEIKRCAAPCVFNIDPREYRDYVRQAKRILRGETGALEEELTKRMEAASEELDFEQAAQYRDRVRFLQSYTLSQSLTSFRGENRDVFYLYREEGLAAVSVIKVRDGRIGKSDNFAFGRVSSFNEELLEEVLLQYYGGGRDVPEEIVVQYRYEPENISLLESAIRRQSRKRAVIVSPKRGIKRRLLKIAELNARQHFSETFDLEERSSQVLAGVYKLLSLSQIPRRIECIDISNLGASDIVAGCVVFFDGQPRKDLYKKYIVSKQGGQDDFAAIHEVTGRRLRRGLREEDLPDLLIIDGGRGQLSAALKAREECSVEVDIVSLAKERVKKGRSGEYRKSSERIFLESRSSPVVLEDGAPVTLFLKRVRDEAHRFAVSFHRLKRSKRSMASVLDGIPGVGAKRRERLFRAFGTISGIADAEAETVAKAGRMPLALAKRVIREVKTVNQNK